jgi:catechol 2,3-dioxygenase
MATPDAILLPYTSITRDRIGVRPPGPHLPDDTRIGRVTLQVSDLDRSLAFYRDVIGFDVLERPDGQQRSAVLGVRSDQRALVELRERPFAGPIPPQGRIGIYHFAVLLPSRGDLGRFLKHATARGVHVDAADHFYSEATYLVDPDGITVEVYRDRARREWLVNPEGELVGPSGRLDFASVQREGGDTPYLGLPSGTTIGHLHFYVGDLARAEAFYHTALGFSKVNWTFFPGMLFVSAGGYHHHVALNTFAAQWPAAGDNDVKLLSWELVLPDMATVEATADSLRQAGVAVAPADGAYVVQDPWGITVRVTGNGFRVPGPG